MKVKCPSCRRDYCRRFALANRRVFNPDKEDTLACFLATQLRIQKMEAAAINLIGIYEALATDASNITLLQEYTTALDTLKGLMP